MKKAVSILYNTKSITVIPKREINLLYKSPLFILQLDYNSLTPQQQASCPLTLTLSLPCFMFLSVSKAHVLSTTDIKLCVIFTRQVGLMNLH